MTEILVDTPAGPRVLKTLTPVQSTEKGLTCYVTFEGKRQLARAAKTKFTFRSRGEGSSLRWRIVQQQPAEGANA